MLLQSLGRRLHDRIVCLMVLVTAMLVHLFVLLLFVIATTSSVCYARSHRMTNSGRGTLEAALWNSRPRAPGDSQGYMASVALLTQQSCTPLVCRSCRAALRCLLDEEIRQLGPPGVVVLDFRSLQHSGTAWLIAHWAGCRILEKHGGSSHR